MQPILAQDILDEARNVYLNDPNAGRYTNAILLPYLRTANNSMETELEENDCQCKNQESAVIPVLANETELRPLPADYVWPISLMERALGSSDRFEPMVQAPWTPNTVVADRLKSWISRLDRIYFLGANQDREVKLFYQRLFSPVNAANDSVYGYGRQFLSAAVAALAHEFISQNETLAGRCREVADGNLAQIVNIQTKKRQAMPVRRIPYSPQR